MPSTLGFTSHSSQVTDWLRAHVVAFDERRASPLVNLGTLGPAGDATATGTRRLVNTGPGAYVWCPGVPANGLTLTDPAELAGASALDVRVVVNLDDYSAASNQYIAAQGNGVAAQSAFEVWFATTGGLRFQASNGTAFVPAAAGTSFDGSGLCIARATWNGATGAVAYFRKPTTETTWLADMQSNSGWTPMGTGTSLVGSLPNSAQALAFMARSSLNEPAAGTFYGAQIATTIDGAPFVDIDPSLLTDEGATSWVTTTGQTVIITRSTGTGYKAEIVLPGSGSRVFNGAEFLEVADNAALDFGLTDSFSVWALVRQYITPATSNTLVAKGSAFLGATGYTLGISTVRTTFARISDGTNNSIGAGGTLTNGLALVTGIRNVTADTLTCGLDSTLGAPGTDASTASLANSDAVRFGRLSGAGTNYFTGRLYAWGIYAGALTAAQWAALRDALLVPQRAAA